MIGSMPTEVVNLMEKACCGGGALVTRSPST